MTILVTGSSGFVASELIPELKKYFEVIGIDLIPSENTDVICDISSKDEIKEILKLNDRIDVLINLAAARFDFGSDARAYLHLNLDCHEKFLKNLETLKIKHFIHISSVASIDGKNIIYSDDLNSDDAYRSTKYLQENAITKWCKEKKIRLSILYPSAIFSSSLRSDTNIGKLQKLSESLKLSPSIDTKKSLTYLVNFNSFIINLIMEKIDSGRYLTIEKPVLTVNEIISNLSRRGIFILKIPFLKQILYFFSLILFFLGGFGRYDMKLTPNRVIKLFSDTSYDKIDSDIDTNTYFKASMTPLKDILRNVYKKNTKNRT